MLKRIAAVALTVQAAVALAATAHLASATAPNQQVVLNDPSWMVCRSQRCTDEMDKQVNRELGDGLWAEYTVKRK